MNSKPFNGITCPICGETNIKAQDDGEFFCPTCEKTFDDPIETERATRWIDDDEDRTISLITRDMLHGDE